MSTEYKTKAGYHVEIIQDLGAGQYLCGVYSRHGFYVTQIAGKDIIGLPQPDTCLTPEPPKPAPLTVLDIMDRLEQIENIAEDDGRAHEKEDDLHEAFICHVAAYPDDPELRQKAELVLTSAKIRFARWYQ